MKQRIKNPTPQLIAVWAATYIGLAFTVLFLLLFELLGYLIYKVADVFTFNFFPESPWVIGIISFGFVAGQVMGLLQFGRVYKNIW